MSKGLHGPSLRYLDPFGLFPQKPPELDEPDFYVFDRICRKLRDTRHLKLLYQVYTDSNWADWHHNQELQWRMMLSYAKPKTVTIRVMLLAQHREDPIRAASAVLDASALALDAGCLGVPLWFEIGNEPNLVGEGFYGDPATFNTWFMAVLAELRRRNFPHGVFYPGLSPYPGYLGWYSDPSTLEALGVSNGIALHAYNEIVDGISAALTFLEALGYGHYPVMLSEIGSVLVGSRMEEFKRIDSLYRKYPMIQAHHIFIVEGKSGGHWPDAYILTEGECREL